MKIKDYVITFMITFAVGLIAAVLVTLLWNYFIKGNGLIVDWGTSFKLAFFLAIIIPFTQIKKK